MRNDLIDAVERMFERSTIGFNRVVPSLVHGANVTYPPFNVIKEGEGRYTIEMALAGYSKDDIKISQSSNFVTIEGNKEQNEKEYLYHGIAARHFKREIPIANGVQVNSAEMKDGILAIFLENKEAVAKLIPVS